jgi:hypothetical protein
MEGRRKREREREDVPPSMTRPVLTMSLPCQTMQTTGPAEDIHLTASVARSPGRAVHGKIEGNVRRSEE